MLKTIPVLDEIIKDEKFSFQSNLHQWFKAMTFEEYKRIKTLFAELGVDFFVEYVPVGGSGSGNTTEEEYKQFKKYLEEGKISNLSNEQVFSLVKKTISKEVMDAYKHCITNKTSACINEPNEPNEPSDPIDPDPKYGLNHKIKKNGSYTSLVIWYVPFNAQDPWPIVENFFVSESAKCLSGCLKKGEKLNSEHVIILEKIDSKEATVSIDFDKASVVIFLETDKVPPIKIQRFRVNYNIQQLSGNLLKCTLPSDYKILSAFRISKARGTLLGDFPKSPNEWNVRLNSLPSNFVTSINAIHDPNNEWEVKIFKNKVENMNQVQCEIGEGFILTGGGVDLTFKPLDEDMRYLVGLDTFYPKDKKTWAVSINGQLNGLQWELTAYAIGIKKKGNLESNIMVSNDNTTWSFYLDDKSLTPVSGGFQLNVPNREIGDILGISAIDLLPGGESERGFAFSWEPTTGFVADSKFIKHVISLKHPDDNISLQPGESEINV